MSKHFPQLKFAHAFVLNMYVYTHKHTPPIEICLPSVNTGVFLNTFQILLHKIVDVKLLPFRVSANLLNFFPSLLLPQKAFSSVGVDNKETWQLTKVTA